MSANHYLDPTCPANCTTTLPSMSFTKCGPKVNAAQIRWLYITNIGQSLQDVEDAAEWATRISNSSGTANAIRELLVIGSKPKPEYQKINIAGGLTVSGKKKHSVPFKIDQTNLTNLAMVRQFECGGSFLGWYETSSNILFGGDHGIEGSIDADVIIDEDSGQLIRIEGTFSFELQYSPEAIESPIAR